MSKISWFLMGTGTGMFMSWLVLRAAHKSLKAPPHSVSVPKSSLLTCADLLEKKWPTMADTLRGYANQ